MAAETLEFAPRESQVVGVENTLPILLVTAKDAARMLSIGDTTLRRLVAAGDIHPVRLIDDPRYRVDEIKDLIARRTEA